MKKKQLIQSLVIRMEFLSVIMIVFSTNVSHAKKISDFPLVIEKVFQQQKNISGKVISAEDKAGVPGVNVVIKGTTKSAITDMNGNYSIGIESNESILVFSSVGYNTQEVKVGSATVINVTLVFGDVSLKEVVVVGFGTQKKSNLTGAVGVTDSKTFENRPVTNAAQMLQGTIAGLNITTTGGSFEDKPTIDIRGVGTIGAGSGGGPLILIDGMPGDLNTINPQDIDNVSVLKDAAASSIYGSRAPFGVILVTTKKGKAGKTIISYNSNTRSTTPIETPNMMDSYTFALFFNDASKNIGASPQFGAEQLQRILDYQNGTLRATIVPSPGNNQFWADGYGYGNANTDWYKELFRDSTFSQEHGISARGATEKTNYYFSGDYLDQKGLMVFNTDTYSRYTSTLKIGSKLKEWLTVNVSTRFTREQSGRPSQMTYGFYQDLARQGWPTLPLYDPNGYLYSSPSPALALRDGGRDKSENDALYQQIQIIVTPLKGWDIFGEFNYSIEDKFRHWDVLKTYNHAVNGDPYVYGNSTNVYEYAYRQNYLMANLYSSYSKTFKEKHNFKIMAGTQSEENKYRSFSAQRSGVILPDSPVLDLTSGLDNNGVAVVPAVAGEYENWAVQGFFGRLNYDFDGKYLIEGNLRYDGTSRYRNENRWKLFPSFSAGWNIAKEDFWKSVTSTFETLKLRVSWGELGNQNTYFWYPTYVTMPFTASGSSWLVNGVKPNISYAPGLVSQNMTWEVVRSQNIGLDIAAFKNRLSSSFDIFTRKTLNMVGPAPELPVTLGTNVPPANNTDLKTYGFEFSASWQDKFENGFGYQIQVALSDSKTKITRYPNKTNTLSTYRTGQMMGEIWGYETIGIAKTNEEMSNHLGSLPNGGQNALGAQWAAGDIMYKDLNGDGKIDGGSNTLNDSGDRKIIGNSTPRFSYSYTLSANYKGFDIRVFFQGVMKRDYFQGSYYFWGASSSGVWWSTGFDEHKDYFRNDPNHPLGENLDSYYARPTFNTAKNQQTQTRYLQNAAYMRLKNLQLGYSLPDSVLKKLSISSLRFYLSGENLWTLTKLSSIFDPETIDRGYGGNTYPISRTISLGLNLNL